MIQGVVDTMHIDEAAAEKDWWVTAVLYALFQTNAAEYLLFKGGTSLSKGWNIIDRFSEDIDLALGREFFLKEMNLSCANCTSNTQIHNLREKGLDYIFGEFKEELKEQLSLLGLFCCVRNIRKKIQELIVCHATSMIWRNYLTQTTWKRH